MVKKTFKSVNFIAFLIFMVLNLTIQETNKWEGFPDCYDYLNQSKVSLFSKDFFFPSVEGYKYPRTFVVPLIYKLACSNPTIIIIVQKILYSISVAFFAYAISLFLKTQKIKNTWLVCCYIIFADWNNLGWSQTLLSESLGISFFLLWLGSFIVYRHKKTNWVLILHLLSFFLFYFTRDNVPYFILFFYFTFILISFLKRENKAMPIALFVISLVFFVIHNKSVEIGFRYKLPLTNTIITRILPNQQYTSWFKSEGMPMIDELKTNLSNVNPLDETKVKVYNMYNDPVYEPFFSWIKSKGKKTYIKFMLSHPSYFFLCKEDWGIMGNKLFADNRFYYGNTSGYTNIIYYLILLLNQWLMLGLIIPIFFFIRKNKNHLFYFTLALFSFVVMILLNYNADTFEVGRHMYYNIFILRVLIVINILLILESRMHLGSKNTTRT